MQYDKFFDKYRHLGVIDTKSISAELEENAQSFKNQLVRWTKSGYITQLRRGLYLFERNSYEDINHFYVANKIYEPSYISLESALSLYSIIPERVCSVTSVCTKKTKTFENKLGLFRYRHLKPSCFRGFRSVNFFGKNVFFAEPEKAVVDFLYFNLSGFDSSNVKEVMLDSYRFSELDELSADRLMELAALFSCKKLLDVVKICAGLIGEL